MINIVQKNDCCGCGACAQACPKSCVTMAADAEGFLYPAVDKNACVNCGLCEKVCPILNQVAVGHQPVEAYAAYAKDDEIRAYSSSGGVFSVLAEQILARQGVVFGAAFDEDFSVHHIKIEQLEDLEKLRGSKYIQSRIENTYREAKKALQEGKTVLFSGVGCQIAGLKAYLGKEYDNLYTVDVLCHGVPSPKVWQKYIQEKRLNNGEKLVNVSFRNKRFGWKLYSVEILFANGKKYQKTLQEDPFLRCFLMNICLRPSCHSCRFKDIPRISDLTIGDAWGIQNHMPDMDDDRGTSVVLVHSEKGKRLWVEIQSELHVRQGDADALLPPTADSRQSVKEHPHRKRFFAALNRNANMTKLTRLTNKSFLWGMLSKGKQCLKGLLGHRS